MSIERSIVFNFMKADPIVDPVMDGLCPSCGLGRLSYHVVDCACHISPPCSACTDAPLRCDACLDEFKP